MHTFLEFGRPPAKLAEAFVSPDSNVESEPRYFYHATSVENAADIAETGLRCFPPHFGTDQQCWPDGKRDKRVYLSAHANKVWMFAPEHGRSVILRTPRKASTFKQEVGTGDIYTNSPIPAHDLEILDSAGWRPLTSAFSK